jgi:hypothetical protein
MLTIGVGIYTFICDSSTRQHWMHLSSNHIHSVPNSAYQKRCRACPACKIRGQMSCFVDFKHFDINFGLDPVKISGIATHWRALSVMVLIVICHKSRWFDRVPHEEVKRVTQNDAKDTTSSVEQWQKFIFGPP